MTSEMFVLKQGKLPRATFLRSKVLRKKSLPTYSTIVPIMHREKLINLPFCTQALIENSTVPTALNKVSSSELKWQASILSSSIIASDASTPDCS